MKTQYTPGPWATDIDVAIEILEREGSDAIEQSAIYVNHGSAKGSEVCVLRHNPDDGLDLRDPEMVANGRLIASAPELLETLEALMEFWDNGTPVNPGAEVVSQARAAIAKAKGSND